MNAKENWLAIVKGEKAERIPYSWEPFSGPVFTIFPMDPQLERDLCAPDGKDFVDSWGTVWQWQPGAPGPHPHITDENIVLKDVNDWKNIVKVPDPRELDWSGMKQWADSVNRDEQLVMPISMGGIFERSHYLMGFEQALMAYMMYPDAMEGLCAAIADFKIALIDEMDKAMNLDVIHFHDDWGTKQNVFLPPKVWRAIIKPHEKRIIDFCHERNIIFMHHADCICKPYIEDMIEIGIDIWQGVIPQNDIVDLQNITKGRICLMGGIDGPTIDKVDAKEEDIRAEVRRAIDTYGPAGHFLPCQPNLIPFTERALNILKDEMISYGKEFMEKQNQKESAVK